MNCRLLLHRKFRLLLLRSSVLHLSGVLCFALCLLPTLGRQAAAQALPAATAPMGDLNPEDQPLPGQQLGTDLTLNQNIRAINAENESFSRFGLGFQVTGGAQTNFFGTETNPVTAAYTNVSADFGLVLHNNRTRYFALYQPEYDMYPQYTSLNHLSQNFFQDVDYVLSERAAITWGTTASRYLSIDQYLPESLGIGGIGFVVPTLQTQALENSYESSNVATSLRLQYLMSTRLTFTGTLTSSWFLLVPIDYAGASGSFSERFMINGGDFRLDYQLDLKDTIGAEVTPIYVYGLNPVGHDTDETLQAIYKRQVTSTLTVEAGAGPLFIQSTSPAYGNFQDTSYAVNAAVSHQIRHSQFTLMYQRAIVVDFLGPPLADHEVNFNSHIPLASHWIITSNALYIHDLGNALEGPGTIYGGSAQIAYQIAHKVQLFAQYSRLSQNFALGQIQAQPYAFSQNQFGAGIRFNIGNPITLGGVQ